MTNLVTPDRQVIDDLRHMLERLARIGAAEVRIVARASAQTTAVFGSTHAPTSLTDDTPLVLVHRGFAMLADGPDIDAVVEIRALLDRMPRLQQPPFQLPLPPGDRTALWAGMLPPQSEWQASGVIDSASLATVAREGAERVQSLLPESPGKALVDRARREVWSLEMLPGIPAAAAFALDGMGFLQGQASVRVARRGQWIRLASTHGDVIVRGVTRST